MELGFGGYMLEIIVTSTAIVMLFFLGLLRLRDGRSNWYGVPAFVVTALLLLAELLLVQYSHNYTQLIHFTLILQALLCPAWLLFSYSYLRTFGWSTLRSLDKAFFILSLLPFVITVWQPHTVFFFSPDFSAAHLLYLEPLSFFLYLQILLSLFLALGNIEATLRAAQHGVRWRVKHALLGVGTLLVVHILFYSQALVERLIDMEYLTLKSGGLILGVVLFYYSESIRGGAGVTLSGRKMVRSAISIIAGLYLVCLGLFLEFSRQFGSAFSHNIFLVLVFFLGLGGIILLMSDTVRRRLRLVLHKWFYREKYDYRSQWKDLTIHMSAAHSTSELFEALLVSFCETFGFAGGGILLSDRQDETVLRTGVFHEMENVSPLPRKVVEFIFSSGPHPLTLKQIEPKLDEHSMQQFAKAGVSVVVPVFAGQEPEGVLLFGRSIDQSEELGFEDYQLMTVQALQVGLTIRSARLGDEIIVAREMEAMGRVAALVLHDLKNQVYSLSLMADNAREYIDDKEFQEDLLNTLGNSVTNMKKVISQLTHLPDQETLSKAPVELVELARRVARLLPQANIRINGGPVVVDGDREQLEKVVLNLLTNAVEAGGEPVIDVEVGKGPAPYIKVKDHAGGIDESILQDGLFVPFRTSKKRGMGIGLYHCRKIMDAHKGKISVENRAGEGATFIVSFQSA